MAIPGVVTVAGGDNVAPIITVIAEEKHGKSSLGVSLAGWLGKEPLFIAWDRTGPDSCLALGYTPKAMRVADFPGVKVDTDGKPVDSFWAKARQVMQNLEQNKAELHAQHNALIIDCASVMSDRLFEEARRFSRNPDPRSHYGDTLLWCCEFMNRVVDLGLPTIWLAWLKKSEMVEEKTARGGKVNKLLQGGPIITGSFKNRLMGKSHHILVLERQKGIEGEPGTDSDGHKRMFHTKPWDNIMAGGRYSHVLPEPMPANLGVVLASVTGKGREQFPWWFGPGAK